MYRGSRGYTPAARTGRGRRGPTGINDNGGGGTAAVAAAAAQPGIAVWGFLLLYMLVLGTGFALVPLGYTLAYALNSIPARVAVCEAGQGGDLCAPCAAGTYSAGGAWDECSACPAQCSDAAGGTCVATTGVCSACSAGYGGALCTACPDETYSLGGSLDACVPCPARCNDGGSLGTCSATTGACTVCDPGRGGALCALCPLGTYSAGGSALDACTACAAGTYASTVGTVTCSACPEACNTTCVVTTGACGACNGTATNSVPTVDLLTASGFAILSHAGITNVPPSDITGDVGAHPIGGTAMNTLSCAEVTGTVYDNNGGYTGGACLTTDAALLIQAKIDLTAAHLNATSRAPNATLSGNNQLAGLTLTAGVYVVDAVTTNLDGTLTLDGEGDPNAVWIFQATTTLITAAGSRVRLTNCAQSCNVFWALGSAATLGANSVFVGTIMAYTNVALTTGAAITGGRAMTLTESVTLQQNAINLVPCSGA